MRTKKVSQVIEGSNNELTAKLAATALSYHLQEKEATTQKIAISALSMYLQSRKMKCSAKLLAQIALAIHFQNEPESFSKSPKSYKAIAPMNSAWNNKILMMRQLPIRN